MRRSLFLVAWSVLLAVPVALTLAVPDRGEAAFPGVNGLIAFTSSVDDPEGDIYVHDIDLDETTRLTDSPGHQRSPSWSPDGSRIAYEGWYTGTNSSLDIFVMDADGSDPVNLTNNPDHEAEPAWSPDGTQIAFVRDTDTAGYVFSMAADGSNPTKLALGTAPAWSPDGSKIAFTGDGDIFVMAADGSNPTKLALGATPAWSPDGSKIAFNRDGDIFVMDSDGSNQENLTNDLTHKQGATAWAPDGTKIAYFNQSGPPFAASELWMMNPDGSGAEMLIDALGGMNSDLGDWQPIPNNDPLAVANGPYAGVQGAPVSFSSAGSFDHDGTIASYEWDFGDGDTSTAPNPANIYVSPGLYPVSLTVEDNLGATAIAATTVTIARLDAFNDDDGSTFESDIEWLAATGITKGCNPPINDRFCPDSVVTRGQMAAFLTRALGLTDRLDDPFSDDDDSVFEADIEKLAAAGITRGCNPPLNDRFCPDGKVTREQMAAFLVRALKYTDDGGGDLFVDDDHSVFEGDIDRLGTAEVTKGCNPPTNDRYCPSGNVTRGQMAAFLHRALG